jgi:hypothetical protein
MAGINVLKVNGKAVLHTPNVNLANAINTVKNNNKGVIQKR